MASRRERTKRAGLAVPPKITPKMIWEGITHPVWSFYTLANGLPRLRTVEHYTNNNDMKFVSGFVGNRLGGTLDWDYCKWLKETWGGPIVLKGILHPEDAVKAIEVGLDGIGVSNHGVAGRAFIYGVAALGKYGGDHVAHILIDDLKNNMVQLGVENLVELREADLVV